MSSSTTAAAAAAAAVACCACSAAAAPSPAAQVHDDDTGIHDGAADTADTLSFVDYQPERYEQLLEQRSTRVTARFREMGLLEEGVGCEIHPSEPSNYRLRCGFGVYDPQRPQTWRLTCPGSSTSERLRYVYWDADALVPVADDTFPIASTTICNAMPAVLDWLGRDPALRAGIRAAKFLSTLDGKLLVTLIYKSRGLGSPGWEPPPGELREVGDGAGEWAGRAAALQAALSQRSDTTCVGVIGRSKGVRVVAGESHVIETGIVLADGRRLIYKQPEQAFSNPNGGMAIHTLNWLSSCAETIRAHSAANASAPGLATVTQKKQSTAAHARNVRTVLVLLLDVEANRLLRVSTERQNAKWDLIGGSVLKGETPAQAAARELQAAAPALRPEGCEPAGNFGVLPCKAEAFIFRLLPGASVVEEGGLGWVSLAEAGDGASWRLKEALSRAPSKGLLGAATADAAEVPADGGSKELEEVKGLQLLELYCGNGNHTVAMSGVFDRCGFALRVAFNFL